MARDASCPNVADLQRLLRGQIQGPEAAALEEHLTRCDPCLQTIRSLLPQDALVPASPPGRATVAEDPQGARVERLLQRLRDLRPGPKAPGQETAPSAAVETSHPASLPPQPYPFLAPPQAPGELGRLGPYRLLKVLGQGGMGVVFQAEDLQLKRLVALKAMQPALAASDTARKRFLREAQAAAALEHDHIVTIHHVGEDRGVPFLAMQLLRGETLAARLRSEGMAAAESGDPGTTVSLALPPAEVLRIGREIAEGLAAAHEPGLIHRDIKPANIWLEAGSGRVKLLDFGLARAVADDVHLTQPGMIAGTPAYMAPEQAAGRAVDHRCDLFSLGCVLYEMATGRLPFPGSGAMAVLWALTQEQPKSPRELNAEVPPALSDLTMRLLAKDPQDRPPTARAVVEAIAAIERAQAQQALTAPARRRRQPLALAAAVLVLGAAGSLLHPAVYRFATGQGQLVIQADDPDVEVTVLQNGARVRIVDTKTGHEVSLQAGTYQLEVSRGKEGLRLETSQFTLKRGGEQIVRVWLEPPAPVAAATAAPAVPPPVVAPAAAATTAPAVRPFVILRQGSQAGPPFATLAEAVAAAQSGDTIEIRGDGPFATPSISIDRRALTLRAGSGFQPVLQLDAKGLEANRPLLATSGPLVLEGLQFQHVEGKPNKEQYFQFIRCLAAPLQVSHCRFFLQSPRHAYLLLAHKSPLVALRHCEFAGAFHCVIDWKSPPFGQLEVADCLSWGAKCFVLYDHRPDTPRELVLRLARNTLVGDYLLGYYYQQLPEPPANPDLKPLRIETRHNLFDASEIFGFALIDNPFQPSKDQALLPRCLAWKEHQNLYDGVLLGLHRHLYPQDLAQPFKTLAQWNDYWGLAATGSQLGRVRYQGGDIRGNRATAPEKITAADLRLHATSAGKGAGPDGRDLGSDVAAVGPGPAYEQWKKTPGYRQWLLDTGQARDPEPFVVLLSGDKTEQRFATLAEAVAWARGGDTVEIRGPGPFVMEPVKIVDKALAIRAGAGFRPMLELSADGVKAGAPLLHTNAPLVLEGLEFFRTDRPDSPRSDHAQVIRSERASLSIAHCRFVVKGEKSLASAIVAVQSPRCEVRHCLLVGPANLGVNWRSPPVGRWTVDNCLIAVRNGPLYLHLHPENVPESQARFTRNALVGNASFGLNIYDQLVDRAEGKAGKPLVPLRVEAEENLHPGNYVLVLNEGSAKRALLPLSEQRAVLPKVLAWHEQGNVHGPLGKDFLGVWNAAAPDKAHGSLPGVAEWNQFWGLQETGAVPGPLRLKGGDLLARLATAPETITPDDFRLLPDSTGKGAGPGGRDLGPDVDLVGPGLAYDYWKKTPAYQQWLQDTGQGR
jgi:hypothetical protein